MYNQGGIGIAAIQVGLPIKAFIVDIPVSKILIYNEYRDLEDPRYLRKKLEAGEVVVIKKTAPIFIDEKMVYETKLIKKIPNIIEKNGEKKFIGTTDESLANYELSPDIIVEHKPYFFLNPDITYDLDEQIVLPEGCLSVPMEYVVKKYNGVVDVKRPLNIKIKYIDENLKEKNLDIKGSSSEYWKWFSRCAQHEYDHTEGILFIDELESKNLTH
jgi:peptide deformylase